MGRTNDLKDEGPCGKESDGGDAGLISTIQRFSVNDGPGIRTTVFMKGCPLACWWCQNPEGIHYRPELMVRGAKCKGAGHCVDCCPEGAFTVDEDGNKHLNREACTLCYECVSVCPSGALSRVGSWMSVEEVMEEIQKDQMFYQESEGGVTISGGEPLFQGAFVASLLKACKYFGFHTALDTCGYASWEIFEKALEHVDLLLFDIKHTEPALHKEATGKGNELILSNLRRIPKGKRIWLRIPLIPGFNDNKENIDKIGEIAGEVGAEKISVLPFHKLAEGKYQQLGRDFPAAGMQEPSKEQIDEFASAIESRGIKVDVSE